MRATLKGKNLLLYGNEATLEEFIPLRNKFSHLQNDKQILLEKN